jgi:dTDP-4-dehydrorhamnose 3,5-epimerase
VQIRELSIPGAYEITPVAREDDRGLFLEWYRYDLLQAAIGHPLELRQANLSVSKRGVFRGIHFAQVPRGQAKYVTLTSGAVIDFIVDVRDGSPTFGQWDSVVLDTVDHRAVYLAEGLGHAFLSLADDTTVTYLVSDTFNPQKEHAVQPLDEHIDLQFPLDADQLLFSPKDAVAPTLAEAQAAGILPTWQACQDLYRSLDEAAAR